MGGSLPEDSVRRQNAIPGPRDDATLEQIPPTMKLGSAITTEPTICPESSGRERILR